MKKIRMIKLSVFTLLLLIISGCSSKDICEKNNLPDGADFTENIIRLCPDTLAYPTEAKSYKWNYEQGLVFEAMYRVWKETKEEKYYNYLKKNIDYYVNEDGTIKTYQLDNFNIDNVASGRVLLHLYEITKEEKYKIAADTLIKQLKLHPRTSEGGFWHKKIYPNQMWLDGLFMAEPFYTEYSKMFDVKINYVDIAKQFMLIKKHLYDEKTGLYYHGWDEKREQKWADPVKGTSPNFWGRSIGWFMMALVDVLDSYPKELKERDDILKIYKELSASIIKYRDVKNGLWYQVIDKQNEAGNYIETSASSMFIYALARGYNNGYLTEEYFKAACESYKNLVNEYIRKDKDGNLFLTEVCSVAGLGGNPYRDGSFGYYISEPRRENDFKGYGALILAANEIMKSRFK